MTIQCISVNITSSGTARMLVKPFLKTTKTFLAPHLKAEVAQSKAVSPAPSTITLPCSGGSWALHARIPGCKIQLILILYKVVLNGI